MTPLDHPVDPSPVRIAPRRGRARLTVATAVLAVALAFQPATSYALSIGSIFGMLEQGRGHHYRGKPQRAHHAHRGHHHHRSAEKPAKPEKPARKSTDGPIFSASR